MGIRFLDEEKTGQVKPGRPVIRFLDQEPQNEETPPVSKPGEPGDIPGAAKPKDDASAIYKRALDAFIGGYGDQARKHATDALSVDPSMTEAKRIIERLDNMEKRGIKFEPLEQAKPTAEPQKPIQYGGTSKRYTPAMESYRSALDAYMAGDAKSARAMASKALSLDPGTIGARRIIERLDSTGDVIQAPAPGIPAEQVQPGKAGFLKSIAPKAAAFVKKATVFPGASGQVPTTIPDILRYVQASNVPGLGKVEELGQRVRREAMGLVQPQETKRGGVAAKVSGKLIMAPLEAGLGLPPGALGKIENEVGEAAVSETGQTIISEALNTLPFTPDEFQQWLGAEAPGIFAPKVAMRLVEKFPLLGKRFNLSNVGPALKEFVTTKNIKIPLGKEELKNFYSLGRESLDPWVYEQLVSRSGEEVKGMLKGALSGKPVFLEKRVSRFSREGIAGRGGAPKDTTSGAPDSMVGRSVAPLDEMANRGYAEPRGPSTAQPAGVGPSVGTSPVPAEPGVPPGVLPGVVPSGVGSVPVEPAPQPTPQQPVAVPGAPETTPPAVAGIEPTAPSVQPSTTPRVEQQTEPVIPQQEIKPPAPPPNGKQGKREISPLKKAKQLTPIAGLRAVAPRRASAKSLDEFIVRNGVAQATDLTTWIELNTDMKDGPYKWVGNNVEPSETSADVFVGPLLKQNTQTEPVGEIGRMDLVGNLNRVSRASAGDSSRFILETSAVIVESGKAKIVSTDGKRLSMSPLSSANLKDGTYILPSNTPLSDALSALEGQNVSMEALIDESGEGEPYAFVFKGDNGRVTVRTVEGSYPNINNVITEPTTQISVSKEALSAAIKEVAPYAKEYAGKRKEHPVRISKHGDRISITVPGGVKGKTVNIKASFSTGKFGKIDAGTLVMPMKASGDSADILAEVNLAYLKDAVDSVGGNEVYIGMTDSPNDHPFAVSGKPFPTVLEKTKTVKFQKRGPGKSGQASLGGSQIEKFEQIAGMESKGSEKIGAFEQLTAGEKESAFKMADKVRGLVKKYAERVGEKYLPRGAEGVFYTETGNIRMNSLNDLSVAVHEIAHALDVNRAKSTEKILSGGMRDIRKALTKVYVDHYPGAKDTHPIKKRMTEGIATLIQKTAEHPTVMKDKFGGLLDEFVRPGGRLYHADYANLLKDTRGIVEEFQKLDKLSQAAAFMTSEFQNKKARQSFLNVRDKIRTEFADAVWPLEKLSKEAGKERTSEDPSLWMRSYQSIVGIIEGNMVGRQGFWIPTVDGGLRKVSDTNFGDLVRRLEKVGLTERFGAWLVARDQYFNWMEADRMAEEISSGKPGAVTEDVYNAFVERLNREPLGRSVWQAAYEQNLDAFKEFGDQFDVFSRAGLDLVEMSGMKKKAEVDALRKKQGYAPLKRDIYDDILGSEEEALPTMSIGKTRISSMIQRKGSSKTYINPLYSSIKDHAEIMRKTMRQMVYNRLLGIAPEFPELFQKLQLKAIPDKTTGKIIFPQEKDNNIIVARDANGNRVPLLVGKDLKNVIDDVMAFRDMHIVESVMRKASRMFSQLTTGAYPMFVLTNLAMDLPTAASNTRTKMIPVWDAMREFGKVLMNRGGPEADYAREWFASHGERQSLAGWQDKDPNEFFRLLKQEKNIIERATQHLSDGVDLLALPGKYSEIMSRLTEYIRSRKMGNSWIVAMEDSARVTTPFRHMGRWGGGTWGKTLVKSISFFNPSIQALDQFVRSARGKDTQKRVLAVLAMITAASVIGMADIFKRGTRRQRDQYDDLEGDSLTGYAWFAHPNGKELIRVRVPEQYGWFAALLNLAVRESCFGQTMTGRDYADAATAWMPDQFNITHPVNALINWIPQLFKPTMEVIFDKRTYPSLRPLTPGAFKYKEPRAHVSETTSAFARTLGNKLNVSPIVIDHLIEGYWGRVPRFVTGRFLNMKMNPYFQDWYFTSGRNLQDFYEMRQRADVFYKIARTGERKLTDKEKRELSHNYGSVKVVEKQLQILKKLESMKDSSNDDIVYSVRRRILDVISRMERP